MVKIRDGRPVLLQQVARVVEGPQVKRGDSSAFVRERTASSPAAGRDADDQQAAGHRHPAADRAGHRGPGGTASRRCRPDIRIAPELYQQKKFIDLAIDNVLAALRDGGILVAIILFLFLLNFRTTFITLTAIPLSIVVTGLVFKWFGMSINTMTLGGLAVAIGELVDDAIVDVENIFRRLRENRHSAEPKPALLVVFQASAEIRNSIVFSTLIIVLVFIPLFALSGMEGRLFTPLGIAYIVSILASLVVSLTVTPCSPTGCCRNARVTHHEQDSFVLRGLKWLAGRVIGFSLRMPVADPGRRRGGGRSSAWLVLSADGERLHAAVRRRRGAAQRAAAAGHLAGASKEVAGMVERRLQKIDGVEGFVARTGRAELDEHVERRQHDRVHRQLRSRERPQPRGGARRDPRGDGRHPRHRHQRRAAAGAPDLGHALRRAGAGGHQALRRRPGRAAGQGRGDEDDRSHGVPGVKDLMVEPQIAIPQLRIELDRDQLARYGLTPGDVNEFVETAMHGKVVSEVLLGQRTFDLFVRLDEPLPREPRSPEAAVARSARGRDDAAWRRWPTIYPAGGPNTINREQVRRRIVLQCNTAGRGLVDVVRDIQQRLEPIQASLPTGYFIEYGGQFESQQSASRMIGRAVPASRWPACSWCCSRCSARSTSRCR